MNRGYAGYYKGVYLRSSYEYAYAKYLDYKSISWEYGAVTYDLGFRKYKPDFFIYDAQGNLKKIVEVKSRDKKSIQRAEEAAICLQQQLLIECQVISYEELYSLYKELPVSLHSVITEWNHSESTSIRKSWTGTTNPHFGSRHSSESKQKIGQKTKKRWLDAETSEKMLAGSKKGAEVLKARKGLWHKVNRVKRECEMCGAEFITLETSSQRFCTDRCGGRYGFQKAASVNVDRKKMLHAAIKNDVLLWTKKHSNIIANTPFNRIKTNLEPILCEIAERYGIKDIRIIAEAVTGKKLGRKDLLRFLQEVVHQL